MVEIKTLSPDQLKKAFDLKIEYLDDDPFEQFAAQYQTYPDLILGCFLDQILIGLGYGQPFTAEAGPEAGIVQLQGIAIQSDYAGRGYGSQLLRRFEEQARQRGGQTVSLGSAGGYVEHFYLKNGYVPVEYLVRIPRDNLRADYHAQGYEILRERWAGDEKFLKIKAAGYDPGFKAELKRAFNAGEVLYIFEKHLG